MLEKLNNSLHVWNSLAPLVTICADNGAKRELLKKIVTGDKTYVLSFVNAHAANMMWNNIEFRSDIASSDLILRDGIGISILLRALGRAPGLNLNGTDLIPELLHELPRNMSIAIFGTKEPYLSSAVSCIEKLGYKDVHSEDGFHDQEYYIKKYIEKRPRIIVLAMGMPKQEHISIALRNLSLEKRIPSLIINGGAIIDYLGKRFPRAPRWIRRTGLEWSYRLIKQPRRLWRRNIGNVVFLWRVILVLIFKRIK